MPQAKGRRFSRFPFGAHAHLHGRDQAWSSELVDISLKGALVTQPAGATLQVGDALRLDLSTDDGAFTICMATEVAHLAGGRVGLRCQHIDLESITHLRRLVELNLGDPAKLDRELHALGTPD
jgi:hypothetical protein